MVCAKAVSSVPPAISNSIASRCAPTAIRPGSSAGVIVMPSLAARRPRAATDSALTSP